MAMTVAICHAIGLGRRAGGAAAAAVTRASVAAVALFEPLVAAVVVAERLPEAGHVAVDQAEPANPLRTLPEVATGDDEPGRPAVLRCQRRAVVLPGDE